MRFGKNMKRNQLYRELSDLLNKHSAENESDSPDFILAEFMLLSLSAFDTATLARDIWYEKEHGMKFPDMTKKKS